MTAVAELLLCVSAVAGDGAHCMIQMVHANSKIQLPRYNYYVG